MESADILQTVAEIAIALAGFGGIAAGLGYRTRGKWRPDDQYRLIGMVRTSLLVVFACLAPFVLYEFGIEAPWREAAALVLVFQLMNFYGVIWIFRSGIPKSYSLIASLCLILVHVAAIVVLLLLSANVGPEIQLGLYLLAVLLLLINAAILFIRLMATSFLESPPVAEPASEQA